MGRFQNKATQTLGNVFRFLDARANISEVDLSGPIQPVFDLSRGAGLARATDFATSLGLVGINDSMVHVGAGDKFDSTADVYGDMAALFGVPPEAIWVWVMDLGGWTDTAASVAECVVSIADPGIEGDFTGAGEGRTLARFNGQAGLPFGALGVIPMINTTAPVFIANFPYLLTPGTILQTASTALLAATIRTTWRLWVGPRFTMPPGLA